ncbi:uncharacterized protein G2W53_018531 [Senna tora]|uniref:Uncharacterized protein n=1 Tax=Senna tora TaxID=362788 RepID=A0A834TTW8_9FABA|nr:uncharacterized protein G2W53_018531 [Senna tora]
MAVIKLASMSWRYISILQLIASNPCLR